MADPANNFHSHWNFIKALNGKKRLEYIFEYYKFHFAIFFIAIIFLAWALNHYIFNPPPKVFFNVSFFGGELDFDIRQAISLDLSSILIPDNQKEDFAVRVDFFDTSAQNPRLRNAASQKFIAELYIADLDILISYIDALQPLAEQGILLPLNDFFEIDSSHFEQNLFFSLNGNSYFNQFGIDSDNLVIAIVSNSKRLDIAKDALLYFSSFFK